MRCFMNISLTPTLEKFVQDKVASGFYNSASSNAIATMNKAALHINK